MGGVEGIDGAYISCGHNCWGILWAPISGLAMAEYMVTGSCNAIDLSPFKPARFSTVGSTGRRGRKKGSMEVGEQW
jgi:glycine/D-amino acid oxidase-like deaminating enzyme